MLAFRGEHALPIPTRALFLGAQPHLMLNAWPDLVGWQPFKPLAAAWDMAGFTRTDQLSAEKWPLIMILPGKVKNETLATFALAKEHLAPAGRLLVAMANTAGAGRFEKELSLATGNITSISKYKCRAFHALLDSPDEARFQAWRSLGLTREVSGFKTVPGIFSSAHIDPGSALLASHLPAHLHGTVADLGAGWGFLSDAILSRCPDIEHLHLYEADARALQCARENLTKYRQPISYHWHDVTTGVPGLYDAIIMNPPFHSGQAMDLDLGRAFLNAGIGSLKRGGSLLLVANRQLPYEAVLETSGLAWRKLAEDKVYKILHAEKR